MNVFAHADITHIDMDERIDPEVAEMRLTLAVRDRQHLADVLRALKRTTIVMKLNHLRPATALVRDN